MRTILPFLVVVSVALRAAPPPQSPEAGTAMLSRQPVAFVENRGQWDGTFTHRARFGAMAVFVQERGWTFTLTEDDRAVAVLMKFGGSVMPATPIAENRLAGIHNYFLGNDPTRWKTKLPLHDAIRLEGLYPGIDVRLRSEQGRFEYDILVAPHADLASVVVEVEGASSLTLDPDGTLVINTGLGAVRQPVPVTWQVTPDGDKQKVACHYVLKGGRGFGFKVPGWNPDLALVVDPGLVYSTYIGGGDGWGNDLALSSTGATTICGQTEALTLPTTMGVFQPNLAIWDAIVTGLDRSGALRYSTYL